MYDVIREKLKLHYILKTLLPKTNVQNIDSENEEEKREIAATSRSYKKKKAERYIKFNIITKAY